MLNFETQDNHVHFYHPLLSLQKISLFCLLSCLSCGLLYRNGVIDSKKSDLIMLRACEEYIKNYTPLYIVNGDTLIVARFNLVPDSINNYLINCARYNNFKTLKCSAALIIRQHREYLLKNDQEYFLQEAFIQKNGFIVLLRQAMKIGNVDDDFTNMDYFPFF